MDTLLENGDFKRGNTNLPVKVTGFDELMQRALIRLSVPKGSFVHDPELGSSLYSLCSGGSPEEIQGEALLLAAEALRPIRKIRAEKVDVFLNPEGNPTKIAVTVAADTCKGEVNLSV